MRLLAKDICHLQRVLSYSFFLLNKCDSAGECRVTCACYDLVINMLMSRPFGFAGTVPEVNFVPAVFAEKGFDCRG